MLSCLSFAMFLPGSATITKSKRCDAPYVTDFDGDNGKKSVYLFIAACILSILAVLISPKERTEGKDHTEKLLQRKGSINWGDHASVSQLQINSRYSQRRSLFEHSQMERLERRIHLSTAHGFHAFSGRSPQVKGNVWFYSHRSCSQNAFDSCNVQYRKQMLHAMEYARKCGIETNHTLTYTALPDYLMNDPTWKKHAQPKLRGRGYWFWKPALANHLLSQTDLGIKDGDILIYLDGDEADQMKRLLNVSANNASWDMVVENQIYCEYQWTKGDIFKHFGVKPEDPHYGRTQQYHANKYVIRVNEKSRKFLVMWEELMKDFHLVSDEASIHPNADGFRENRHDQSMYSMLLKASLRHNGNCSTGRTIRSQDEELGSLPIVSDSAVAWRPHEKFGIHGLKVIVIDRTAGVGGSACPSIVAWGASWMCEWYGG